MIADALYLTQINERKIQHAKAKTLLRQGHYLLASQVLESAKRDFGNNVMMLADLVCCHYMNQHFGSWEASVEELRTELKNEKISCEHFTMASITLAQSLEEMGRIQEAYSVYKMLFARVENKTAQNSYLMILSQLVRLSFQYFPVGSEAYKYYLALASLVKVQAFANMDAEIQHALILAECNQFGPGVALIRLKQVIDTKRFINSHDQAHFVVDAVEIVLRQKDIVPSWLVNSLRLIEPKYLGPYGQALRDMVLQRHLNTWKENLLQKSFSPAEKIRYLILLALQNFLASDRDEIHQILSAHLLALAPEDRITWIHFWKNQGARLPTIFFCSEAKTLTYQSKEVSLGRRQNAVEILNALMQKPDCSWTEISEKLWKQEFDDWIYHRLRMSIQRLNTLALREFNLTKFISFNSEKIWIHLKLLPRAKL